MRSHIRFGEWRPSPTLAGMSGASLGEAPWTTTATSYPSSTATRLGRGTHTLSTLNQNEGEGSFSGLGP